MSRVISEHRRYVADRHKLGAFESALRELVRRDSVVLDLGAGTGLLGLLACKAGAARVYAVDGGPIIGLARELAAENGWADRIVHIRDISTAVELPEKVDVVVSDQLWGVGLDAGVLEYTSDIRRRLLAPGGVFVPGRLRIVAAPVTHPEAHEEVSFWERSHADLSFAAALPTARNSVYHWRFGAEHLLASGRRVAEVELGTERNDVVRGEADFEIDAPGLVHGFGVWWEAQLSPSVSMTNAPASLKRVDRANAYLPVPAPVSVRAGDRVTLRLSIDAPQALTTWHVAVHDPGATQPRVRAVGSTFAGALLSREDLARSRPGHIPNLSAWGRARRTALELCDGRNTMAQIEAALQERYPTLFVERGQVASFVADLVMRNAR